MNKADVYAGPGGLPEIVLTDRQVRQLNEIREEKGHDKTIRIRLAPDEGERYYEDRKSVV